MDIPGPLPFVGDPPLAYRFGVLFLTAGVFPNPLDLLFQKVSGIGSSIDVVTVEEGGQNLYVHQFPERVTHDNLVLERGVVVPSPLSIEFNVAMSLFKFSASNVLVTLLDRTNLPVSSWLFWKAFPVEWSISDLDADANEVVIEHLELSYQRMQTIGL